MTVLSSDNVTLVRCVTEAFRMASFGLDTHLARFSAPTEMGGSVIILVLSFCLACEMTEKYLLRVLAFCFRKR